MTRPCWLTCACPDPCDYAERAAEARHDADDLSEPDRGQRAEEQADREERARDEWFGGYAC